MFDSTLTHPETTPSRKVRKHKLRSEMIDS